MGRKSATTGLVALPRMMYPAKLDLFWAFAFARTSSYDAGPFGLMSLRHMNISTLPTMVTPSSAACLSFSLGGTGPRGGGQVPTSHTTWATSASLTTPSGSRGVSAPIVPNFGIHGSSIIARS